MEEIMIDDSPIELIEVKPTGKKTEHKAAKTVVKKEENIDTEGLISCLKNERVIVRHIPKLSGIWGNNPRHVLAGGMAENAVRTFVVPRLRTGSFVDVLTDNEKAFLESYMGLEYNALSVHKKVDNFWDDGNEIGISRVTLGKHDNYLNLSDPEDYIKYKILLANKDFIAPSLQVLEDAPKATYQFVIIAEGEETKSAKDNMSITMKCYKEYGKIEDDRDTLRVIVELLEGKPTSPKVKLEFLQTRINSLIQADSKIFLKIISDPMLPTKVLIKKCIEENLISNRDGHLYYNNQPLCEANEESTLNMASKYLNSPKHQELKLSLEAKLK